VLYLQRPVKVVNLVQSLYALSPVFPEVAVLYIIAIIRSLNIAMCSCRHWEFVIEINMNQWLENK
jgi:hypothetical protein